MINDDKFLLLLGKKIDKLSSEKFPTQIAFSDASDVDSRTLRRIIKAEQNPTILMLRKISNALEISLDELVRIE